MSKCLYQNLHVYIPIKKCSGNGFGLLTYVFVWSLQVLWNGETTLDAGHVNFSQWCNNEKLFPMKQTCCITRTQC